MQEETVTNDGNDKGSVELLKINPTKGRSGASHIPPPMNTSMTPSLPFGDSRNRQTIGIGNTKMKRSEIKFMEPYAKPA